MFLFHFSTKSGLKPVVWGGEARVARMAWTSQGCLQGHLGRPQNRCANAMAFETHFGPVLGGLKSAKVVISLRTSSKNALIKKRGSKTIPWPLFDRSCTSFEPQEGLNKGPQSDPQTLVRAQNTVNNGVF